MQMDPIVMNTIFLACQRSVVEEQLGLIPASERLTYDEYKNYIPRHKTERSLAWTDAFPGVSAWLADRDVEKIEREKLSSGPGYDQHGMGSLF